VLITQEGIRIGEAFVSEELALSFAHARGWGWGGRG
jgi:hypothetical protein